MHQLTRIVSFFIQKVRIILIVLISVIVPSFEVLALPVDLKGRAFDILIKVWSGLICWVAGIRFHVEGYEHIPPRNESMIILCNHQSAMDIPVIASQVPLRVRFVLKQSLYRVPFLGWSLLRHCIGIDRSSGMKAFQKISERALVLKSQQASFLIYPEGTRSPDGTMLPFKKGAFLIATLSQLPVLPVVLDGTHYINPKKSLIMRTGLVHIKYLEPIYPNQPQFASTEKLKNYVERKMNEALIGLRQVYGNPNQSAMDAEKINDGSPDAQ
jgi:1-acyl-sn-glycerol-3-phosphate acyltransferase